MINMLVALCITLWSSTYFSPFSTFRSVVLLVGYSPFLVYTVGETNKYLNIHNIHVHVYVEMWENQMQAIKMLYETL